MGSESTVPYTPDESAQLPFSPWRKLVLGAEILAAYTQVRWLMRRGNLPATVAALRRRRRPGRSRQDAGDLVIGLRLGHATRRALEWLPADTRCLNRSLVLTALLARRDVESSLVIGVESGDAFGAHAWVEHDQRALLPTSHEVYARLLEL